MWVQCGGSATTRRRAGLRRDAKRRKVAVAINFVAGSLDVLNDHGTKFGGYVSSSLDATARTPASYPRDIFPLPLVSAQVVTELLGSRADLAVNLATLINASVCGLNYLYADCMCTSKVPTHMRLRVHHVLGSIGSRWLLMGQHLASNEGSLAVDSAYDKLVKKYNSANYIPLKAECVDLPSKCGAVDPTTFLPTELRTLLRDPSSMFPDGVAHMRNHPRFAGSWSEYILLVRRQLRKGKVRLALGCMHAAPVFVVKKKTPGRQREVWNGGPLSRATCPL